MTRRIAPYPLTVLRQETLEAIPFRQSAPPAPIPPFQGYPLPVIPDICIGLRYLAVFIVLAPISSAFDIKVILIGSPVAEAFVSDGKLPLFAEERITLGQQLEAPSQPHPAKIP